METKAPDSLENQQLLIECLRMAGIISGFNLKPNDIKTLEAFDKARDAVFKASLEWNKLPAGAKVGYTRQAIKNAVINSMRAHAKGRRSSHDEFDERKLSNTELSVESIIDSERAFERLAKDLETHLHEPIDRKILLMSAAGYNDKEIAEELGLKDGLVRTRKHRAKLKLTSSLKKSNYTTNA